MSQTYPSIGANDKVVNSRQRLLDRDDTIRSCFEGTAFPSNPVIGQLCYRSDLGVLYQCKALEPDDWEPMSAGLLAGLVIDPNASGTTETIIATHLLGASAWSGNKRVVKIQALALSADNGNVKQMKLYFGSTLVAESYAPAMPRNMPLSIDAVVVRKTSTSQVARAIFMGRGALDMEQFLVDASEDLSQAVTVSVRASGDQAGDIILKWFSVEIIG